MNNIKLSILKQHSRHKRLYSNNAIESLAESIKESGQLEPIVVIPDKKDFLVISGWRRVLALRFLERKEVTAIISTPIPPDEIIRVIIHSNRQRIKSMQEKWNEIEELKKYLQKKQGARTDKMDNLSMEERKHTNVRIAEAMGISTGNLHKIEKIVEADPAWLALIDTGEESIHSAHEQCVKPKKQSAKAKSGLPVTLAKLYNHKCPECGAKFN